MCCRSCTSKSAPLLMIKKLKQIVIGFDIREMWMPFSEQWPQERIDRFCLREDVKKVLSTDTRVWPSVFDLESVKRPEKWFGFVQNQWASLSTMRQHLDCRQEGQGGLVWTVGLTLVPSLCDEHQLQLWDNMIGATDPLDLNENWALLGYDVSDKFLLSGLSNCGFAPEQEDVEEMRRRWSSCLNHFHLFEDPLQASEYAKVADMRVSEHAPFFVFGLWRLRQ